MLNSLLADALLLLHSLFVAFAVAGGALVLWRPLLAWAHVPCVLWAGWIELSHGICPLTPLEQRLRALAGEGGYEGGFIAHYVMPVLYPAGLTPQIQTGLGIAVLALNLLVYAALLRRLSS